MAPNVQFTAAADGTCIAYTTHGRGRPLVFVRNWLSHVEAIWDLPGYRAFFDELARHFRVALYDMRCNGLSDRNLPSVSADDALADLAAVVEACKLDDFVLYGQCFGGPTAIAYAARHPERVSALILDGTYARGADLAPAEQRRRLVDWLRTDPNAAILTLGYLTEPEPSAATSLREHYARIERWRESMSSHDFANLYELGFQFDVTPELAGIRCPTLVLHRRNNRSVAFQHGRDLAARIPGARFVALPGSAANPWDGDASATLRAIEEFLGVGQPVLDARDGGDASTTVLFTDMESSTQATQRLGDAAAQALVREHNAAVRKALGAHGGREVKHTGDGIMAAFTSASHAVEAAIAIQRALAERDGGDESLRVRIGLNAGEPIVEEQDLFGTAVQLAKRVCDAGEPGEILVSNVVRELCAGKRFLFADRGVAPLKGFDEPVHLYEVRWAAESS